MLLELETQMYQRASGVLFVAITGNRSVSVGLTDGWITYAFGRRAHGQKAIELLQDAEVVNFAFTRDTDYPFRSRDEIVHDEAMAVLHPLITEAQAAYAQTQSTAEADSKTARRFYRGQPVDEPQAATTEEKKPGTGKKKSVRYYRGHRVED